MTAGDVSNYAVNSHTNFVTGLAGDVTASTSFLTTDSTSLSSDGSIAMLTLTTDY